MNLREFKGGCGRIRGLPEHGYTIPRQGAEIEKKKARTEAGAFGRLPRGLRSGSRWRQRAQTRITWYRSRAKRVREFEFGNNADNLSSFSHCIAEDNGNLFKYNYN